MTPGIVHSSDVPKVQWMNGQVTKLDGNGQEIAQEHQLQGRDIYEDTISTIYADFFVMVLVLSNMTPKTDDGQTCHQISI